MHPLDLYCERTSAGLLAEPLNTLSNLSFFLAAWLAWRKASVRRLAGGIRILVALLVAIGLGSSAFHVFASEETHILDLVPILAFELFFLWYYARHAVRISPVIAAILIVALLAVSLYAEHYSRPLNGSLLYVPSLAALIAMAVHESRSGTFNLAYASALLIVSLFLRTIDLSVCERLPVGTHFIWHVLNAAVLYLCVRSAMPLSMRKDEM